MGYRPILFIGTFFPPFLPSFSLVSALTLPPSLPLLLGLALLSILFIPEKSFPHSFSSSLPPSFPPSLPPSLPPSRLRPLPLLLSLILLLPSSLPPSLPPGFALFSISLIFLGPVPLLPENLPSGFAWTMQVGREGRREGRVREH